MQEATINELMLRQAEERTILADFSKFGVSHSFRYGSIGNIHRLITDTKAPVDEINAMKAAGLQILQARIWLLVVYIFAIFKADSDTSCDFDVVCWIFDSNKEPQRCKLRIM